MYDGHNNFAQSLSKSLNLTASESPSARLEKIVQLGLKTELEYKKIGEAPPETKKSGTGIDLEFENEADLISPEPALYKKKYTVTNEAACCTGAFSDDGAVLATGMKTGELKVIDVDKMNRKMDPLIARFNGEEEVTCLQFHPVEEIVIAGFKDSTIKFFEYRKNIKHAFKIIYENDIVTSLAIHKLGNYMLVGTQHPVLRLYDLRTLQSFICDRPKDQHTGPITMIRYGQNFKVYVSASEDGAIKIWDTVSNRCINTLLNAHHGAPISSVQFSRNSKYLLSSGKDSCVKLWELSMSRCLLTYIPDTQQQFHSQAVFNHTEDYVLFPDDRDNSLCCWNSRNGERRHQLYVGHTKRVRYVEHSHVHPVLLTCSDDFNMNILSQPKSKQT